MIGNNAQVQLKVKLLDPEAKVPGYAKPGDAAMDLTAIDDGVNTLSGDGFFYREYRTGLAFEIPEGHVGYIFPRSSISNTALSLTNAVGVIDSGYRGEVRFRFRIDPIPQLMTPTGTQPQAKVYKKGDRIGQLIVMPIPYVAVTIVDDLSTSERGTGGFGSSGA